jgi:hypothetical protein
MKRISEFTADRMDMKQMAAISGGAVCHGSSTISIMTGTCGMDTTTTTWEDGYFNHPVTGERIEYRYNYHTSSDLCY